MSARVVGCQWLRSGLLRWRFRQRQQKQRGYHVARCGGSARSSCGKLAASNADSVIFICPVPDCCLPVCGRGGGLGNVTRNVSHFFAKKCSLQSLQTDQLSVLCPLPSLPQAPKGPRKSPRASLTQQHRAATSERRRAPASRQAAVLEEGVGRGESSLARLG